MRVVQNRDCDRWCMKDQNNLAKMTGQQDAEIFHHCQHSPLVFYGFWLLTAKDVKCKTVGVSISKEKFEKKCPNSQNTLSVLRAH
ncbi:uncharacterized protein LOC118647305 isoform X2 [Monomorium pharaonis]|uniref:uncharacterized protein LOC118647305 isoform X2 n=1 Tax=Monomorium pharaonis TaxID=307658 RepID=UPI001746CA92|nr:uncharacterized protein LOC118647305 isoform X2 [Monomorium pharaonis]